MQNQQDPDDHSFWAWNLSHLDRAELVRYFTIRARYYIPVFGWLPKYEFHQLQYDVIAGVTVAFLIIPQSLSYAQALVNVPPVLGLYSAFITQFVYSCLGTSRYILLIDFGADL